ncbi:MAG TPA: hypothetical protein VFE42_26165 [Chloroflexota bacterium]|nr:hypothetical protein [Chloroflexota bacterium]
MSKDSKKTSERVWQDSAHASLCVLGTHLRRAGFFAPLEERVRIKQKVLKYTAVQKLEMLFVALLAGAKAVAHTATTVRVDPALCQAFGLPGCAEQSVIADTLDAATAEDVAALQEALAAVFGRYSQALRHDTTRELLVIDVDLSPLPASAHAEGSTRGYLGRCRSKTGRKLVRVRAAQYQETVWETVVPAREVESLPLLQEAIAHLERLFGLEGGDAEATAKRARVEIRLDSGWGTDTILPWLLGRGYQVTGKFRSPARVRALIKGITAWSATSSPGREVAEVPQPLVFDRPLRQYAVRTPSSQTKSGYYHAVVFTTRSDVSMTGAVDHYDGRAGMEADLKGDKRGLGLGVIRKHRLAAQQMVILLMQVAHNVLVWARTWLATQAPRLRRCGIVRLIQEVWAIPGRVKLTAHGVQRVRLRRTHPHARDVCAGLRPLLPPSQTLVLLG